MTALVKVTGERQPDSMIEQETAMKNIHVETEISFLILSHLSSSTADNNWTRFVPYRRRDA